MKPTLYIAFAFIGFLVGYATGGFIGRESAVLERQEFCDKAMKPRHKIDFSKLIYDERAYCMEEGR